MSSIPATDDLRNRVTVAVQGVVWNASNHPDPVAVLGRDITPLTAKVVDALMPLIREAQAQAWREGLHAAYDYISRQEDADATGQYVSIPDPANPYADED